MVNDAFTIWRSWRRYSHRLQRGSKEQHAQQPGHHAGSVQPHRPRDLAVVRGSASVVAALLNSELLRRPDLEFRTGIRVRFCQFFVPY